QHWFGDVVVGQHLADAAGQVRYLHAHHGVDDLVGVGGAGGLDRFHPHVEADVVRFHRIVGHALGVAGELVPGLDERFVGRVFLAHEVVPGGHVADQRGSVDTRQLFLTDREGDHRDILGRYALVAQFAVEGDVGITIDGGHHGGLLAGTAEALDLRDDVLPIRVAEGGVIDQDVLFRYTLGLEVGLEDAVGGPRIDVVGTCQDTALDPHFVLQAIHRLA